MLAKLAVAALVAAGSVTVVGTQSEEAKVVTGTAGGSSSGGGSGQGGSGNTGTKGQSSGSGTGGTSN